MEQRDKNSNQDSDQEFELEYASECSEPGDSNDWLYETVLEKSSGSEPPESFYAAPQDNHVANNNWANHAEAVVGTPVVSMEDNDDSPDLSANSQQENGAVEVLAQYAPPLRIRVGQLTAHATIFIAQTFGLEYSGVIYVPRYCEEEFGERVKACVPPAHAGRPSENHLTDWERVVSVLRKQYWSIVTGRDYVTLSPPQ